MTDPADIAGPAQLDGLDRLGGLLTTRTFGRAHEHHVSLPSTNDRALAWLGESAPDGALVTADAQTAGRGRLGRRWSSPPGRDLYASVVVRPGAVPAGFGALALAVGVGLREGLLTALPELHDLALKWPNDLLLGDRKLAGILCESRWRGAVVELVVGFGINVHRRSEEFEPELRGGATSLAQHARAPGRAVILAAVLASLEQALDAFFDRGFAGVRDRYAPHCVTLGRDVLIERTPGGPQTPATAVGLDTDGALLVRTGPGPTTRVESADVWLR